MKELKLDYQPTELIINTMNGKLDQRLKRINDLIVWDFDLRENMKLPIVYSQEFWPFRDSEVPTMKEIDSYEYLKDVPFRFEETAKVGLLIGMNVPGILFPIDAVPRLIPVNFQGPYATLHTLGWALQGPINLTKPPINVQNFCTKIEEESSLEMRIQRYFARDFSDDNDDRLAPSIDEQHWYKRVGESCKQLATGHYEIDLPFKKSFVAFPRNKYQALRRFESLQLRLQRDERFSTDYKSFMQGMIEKGFAIKVPKNEIITQPGKSWYLVHHGIRHKQKKKLRVVFDCSLKCQGVSLNNELWQGPDLTNNLVSVLLKFREEHVAFMADVEKMFYSIKVPKSQQDFLRFFWMDEKENRNSTPVEYRLSVHVFGAISSPAIANYALQKAAAHLAVDDVVRESIFWNFYVDDILKSYHSVVGTCELIRNLCKILSRSGFNLTGFTSNNRNVLNTIPMKHWSKNLSQVDIWDDELPSEGALGVVWNTQQDTLGFRIIKEDKVITRRNILSAIFSIYDPLGLIGPTLILARRIFQTTCRRKLGWDQVLDQDLQDDWKRWERDMEPLSSYSVKRCLKPPGEIASKQLHIFADGSNTAYGVVAYARFTTTDGVICCTPIMSKARTTPLDRTTLRTIPRIELSAARLAVSVYQVLHRVLGYEKSNTHYWSDSEIVLRYINNTTSNFQTFVANRLHIIAASSDTSQWRHVATDENPADLISRGCSVSHLFSSNLWAHGPPFLSKIEIHWPTPFVSQTKQISDLEVKRVKKIVAVSTMSESSPTDRLLRSRSDWWRLRKRIAAVLRIKRNFSSGFYEKLSFVPFTTNELQEASIAIIRHEQYKYFKDVFKLLYSNDPLTTKRVPLNHELSKLRPQLDENTGLLVVGGRLNQANLSVEVKHPIILPRKSDVTTLIIKHCHVTVGHMGISTTLARLRESYWLVTSKCVINKVLRLCLLCKRAQGRPIHPEMSDLPPERLQGGLPPFTNVGTDCFGPFMVHRGRTTQKRYGVIFVCLASRAIHLDVLFSMDSSAFISAFRRFLSYFPHVKNVRSDNGSNFVGADREMKQAMKRWNVQQLHEHMLYKGINWKFSAPSSSHQNGIWERQIRIVRRVFGNLLRSQRIKMRDDDLRTFFDEVRFIINSRPLCALSNDTDDFEALTANHLLHIKGGTLLPPGTYNQDDCYSKKRWLQVQYLIDLFWKKWKAQCLPLLQERQKWRTPQRNFKTGDLVLIIDQLTPRGHWALGRIESIESDSHNRVAWVKVAKACNTKPTNYKCTVLRRPVNKLILLSTVEELN